MSYILKALKRAEQQRRRGTPPGLADALPAEPPRSPRRRGRLLWTGAVAVVVLAAVGAAWWWLRTPWRVAVEGPLGQIASVANEANKTAAPPAPTRQADPPPAGAGGQTKPTAPTAKQTPPASGKSTAATPAAAAAPARDPGAEEVQVVRPPGRRDLRRGDLEGPGGRPGRGRDPRSRERAGPGGAPASGEPVTPGLKAAPAVDVSAAAVKTAAAVPAEKSEISEPQPIPSSETKAQVGRDLAAQLAQAVPEQKPAASVPDWRELPLETRKAIPDLKFSMLVYAEQPADRLLSVNGTVYHEGAVVEPDLTLVEITPDGAVFRYKNTLFHRGVF